MIDNLCGLEEVTVLSDMRKQSKIGLLLIAEVRVLLGSLAAPVAAPVA